MHTPSAQTLSSPIGSPPRKYTSYFSVMMRNGSPTIPFLKPSSTSPWLRD